MKPSFSDTKLRKAYPNNPIIGYLNINSLKEKIICLRDFISTSTIDMLCIDETKLDTSFPDSKGGGKIVYGREGIVAKRLSHCESPIIESICLELTISK